MIVVVDYEMGNIGSILNILKKLGQKAIASNHPDEIEKADKLILPGVGAFDTGMSNLEKFGLIEPLNEQVIRKKKPILGICIGLHLMAKSSEEGTKSGLAWFDMHVKKFNFDDMEKSYHVPCVGWNIIHPKRHSLLFPDSEEKRFYFVHSYYVQPNNHSDIIATAHYGFDYAVALNQNNLYGVQFHPEKSHKFGIDLFKQFVKGT